MDGVVDSRPPAEDRVAEPARKLMSVDEFLDWCQHQEGRYELVDGHPRAMTGATQRHDLIVVNALAALHGRLRGGPCRPSTADVAVVAPRGNIRRPDLTVSCDPIEVRKTSVAEPKLVLEVLSRSTEEVDLFEKLEEYKGIRSLAHIVIAEPAQPRVLLWSRDASRRWTYRRFAGLSASLPLGALGCELPLNELYEGVPLQESDRGS